VEHPKLPSVTRAGQGLISATSRPFLRQICEEARGKELARRLLAKWYDDSDERKNRRFL